LLDSNTAATICIKGRSSIDGMSHFGLWSSHWKTRDWATNVLWYLPMIILLYWVQCLINKHY